MFDKFKKAKQINDLRRTLSKEKEEVEKKGVKVIVNGQMRVDQIIIEEEVPTPKVEGLVKDCVNEALKKMQKKAAAKMQEMGGF